MPDDALTEEAMRIADRLAGLPTNGLARIKRAFDAAEHNGFDAQLDLERDLQREAGRDPDYAEGVAAFIEKRSPRFADRS